MDYTKLLSIPKGAAVCYSGFREGQRPGMYTQAMSKSKKI